MLELTLKLEQDFLNPDYARRLLEAGINMDDATYFLYKLPPLKDVSLDSGKEEHWCVGTRGSELTDIFEEILPTYTLSELIYKLSEYVSWTPFGHYKMSEYPRYDVNETKFEGTLSFTKDAPFYFFYYKARGDVQPSHSDQLGGISEYPIYAAANLLIRCAEKSIYYFNGVNEKEERHEQAPKKIVSPVVYVVHSSYDRDGEHVDYELNGIFESEEDAKKNVVFLLTHKPEEVNNLKVEIKDHIVL